MTPEQRLQLMIGQQAFQIVALSAQLEQAQAEIAELKKDAKPTESNPA